MISKTMTALMPLEERRIKRSNGFNFPSYIDFFFGTAENEKPKKKKKQKTRPLKPLTPKASASGCKLRFGGACSQRVVGSSCLASCFGSQSAHALPSR